VNRPGYLLTAAFAACVAGTVVVATASATAVHAAPAGTEPAWTRNVPIERIVEWRRHLHQHPELSHHETMTSDYVAGVLQGLGDIEVKRPTPTSVVGVLRGARPGRTVAFRADLDALPVPEQTGLPFASAVAGVSHACGHDMHSAMLLGTATTLARMRGSLAGTVVFIFQHAEEVAPGGAQEIIASGALAGVGAFFGMHVFTGPPAGHVGIMPAGAASTAADNFTVTIHGKGSHGAMPHLGVDPVVAGAAVVSALQTVVSRNVTPGEMAVVTVGKFHAGTAPNIIPDQAELAGTVRTVTDSTRRIAAERVKAIVEAVVAAHGATCTLDYRPGPPAVVNDPALVDLARASAVKALGADQVYEAPRMSASEDFARYRELAPICFLALGAGPGPANHSPYFDPDESAMANGVKAQVQILLDYLAGAGPRSRRR
jgi:amidohydrolase